MTTREELEAALKPHWSTGWFQSVDVGDGWIDLIYTLHLQLEYLDPTYSLNQIKEKFGGLRFYFSGNQGVFAAMQVFAHKAENQSYKICESCGTTENVSIRKIQGWSSTYCDGCDERVRDRIAAKAADRASGGN